MTIDEILAKYQKALTKKQIEDLIRKSEQYKLLNAGNRANAQTQLAKQYRQTRRGLQNMGLAGREGKLLSGREIGVNDAYRNAYGTYNQQLQQAEGAMLEQDAARKAASTARARAAAAQKAAEEAKAKAEAQLAEQQQMQNNEKWDAMHPGSQWSRNPQLYTKDEQDALWNYDPFKHTADENVNYYHQIAEQNGMKGVEANRYAMSMAADVENRKGAAAEAIQPHGLKPNQEQIQKNLPSLRFAQDYGVNLMKLKQEDPAMAQTIENDVKYWYDFIDEKSEFWNNAIRNKTKDYHAALQMQANSYAALAKLSLAAKAPAEQRKYYLMSDAQFDTAYDAAERAYMRAEQEYQIAKKDSSSTMDDVISEPKAALEKATQMKNLMDQIKANRASNSTVNLLAYQMQIPESAKTKDKEYASTKEYVDENQIGRITVNGKNGDQSFNGRETNPSSNWSSIRNLGWSADDYAKRHETKGSKYAALINEWSLINGRTAALYGPGQLDNLDPDAIGGTLDFIQMLFGANRADTDVNYKWFRDQCLMALRGNYDDTGSNAQKEQMDAMLTLANLMTNEERARFNALLETMGANAADEYFDLLYKNVLPERFTAYVSDYNADYMDELPWAAKAAFSVESVLPSLTQGIPGIAHAYSTNQQDPAAARVSATGYNQAQNIRNARMQKFGKFGQFAYGTAMSMWDSYFSAAISSGIGNALEGVGVGAELAGKIGSTIGGSLLGASAYNSTYQEGLERGLTPEKARMTALGAGINEMLFESLSLDLVVGHYQKGGILKVSKKAWVNWIVNTLVQGGVEGSEEVFTDIGNNLWDKMVNGIYSEELTKIREYVSQGMTLEEAKRKVSGEFAAQLGMSFAGGFASGGVMGGGSTFLGMVQNIDVAKIGSNLDENAKAEIREYDFQNEEAKEILTGKLTDEDYGRLAMTRLEEMAQTDPIAAEKAAQALIDATARTDVKVDKRNQTLKTGTENSVSFDYDGVTDVKKMSGVQVEALRFAQTLVKSKVGGVNINVANQLFDKNGNEQNGWYDAKTNTVHVSLNGSQSVVYTISHELTHRLKSGNEEAYASMRDAMKSELESLDLTGSDLPGEYENILGDYLVKDGEQRSTWEALIEYEMDRYKKHGITLDRESAEEEVVCRACETMLERSRLISSMISKNVRGAKTIAKFLASIYDDIASLKAEAESRGYEDGSPEKLFIDQYTDVEKIANAWASAMKTVSEKEEKRKPKTERIAKSKNGDYARLSKSETAKASGNIDVTDDITAEGVDGKPLSIKSLDFDMHSGKMYKDLVEHGVMTEEEVVKYDRFLKALIAYIKPNRVILDMNESYTKDNRPFTAFKDNSDPLYKLSLDFSTLCRKRLTTQYIIEKLQLKLKKALSAEEQLAVRAMLKDYQKIDKGLQVACGMCYVEAARYKSPKQINMWLESDGRRKAMVQYFAVTDKQFTETVKQKQAEWKARHGYADNATKKEMSSADVTAFNKMSYDLRQAYEMDEEHQAIMDKALSLPKEQFLSAANLAELAEGDEAERTIYNAYTRFIRAATRSKSLEADIPYYYGDSESRVSDTFIENVNAENGMRFDSWSDFQFTHLLDMITAITDLSVRGSAMHGYTKFPEFVRIFGKTGAMFNLSGVPQGIGLKQDGSLDFSPTESINEEEAIKLREEFPETAGFQSIGINDRHINALLDSDFIDYVIPYHVSGMNAKLRSIAKIAGWADYTGTQNAKIDKSLDGNKASCDPSVWHVEPVFSEFFVGYNTGMSGIDAMRASAERYVDMCHERGMKPKFEQFLENDNYWKLLIDRKMINQKTGALIEQKAVKPNFDLNTIKREIDKYVNSYDQNREENAFQYISERWDEVPALVAKLEKEGKAEKKRQKEAAKNINMLKGEMVNAVPGRIPAKAAAQKFSIKESSKLSVTPMSNDVSSEMNTKFSIREEAAPTKTQDVYKLMRLGKDGRLYPLFIDSAEGIDVGVWYNADSPDMSDLKTLPSGVYLIGNDGKDIVTLADYQRTHGEKASKFPSKSAINAAATDGKRWVFIEDVAKGQRRYGGENRKYWNLGINGSGSVSTFAMRPGWHAGSLPTMRQIGKGANRNLRDDTFVWVKGRVSADVDYQAEASQNPDNDIPTHIPTNGFYMKATNPNATAAQTDTVGWYIAGAFIADKIMSDSEARNVINDWNASHPSDHVEYDWERESGGEFDAETMSIRNAKYSLKEGEERAVKIADGKTKDGTTVSFIDRILDGQKTGETRTTKGSIKPNAWVGIYKDSKVYGRVKFGDPMWITKQSKEYNTSYIKDTNYDIDDSVGGKWYYPVLDVQDFRDNPIPTNRAGQWGAAYNLPKNVRYSLKDTVEGESLGKDYLKYLQLGTKVVNQTATEEEIRDFKQRMNALSQDNREAFLDKLREKLIRADEAAKVRLAERMAEGKLRSEERHAAEDREAKLRDRIDALKEELKQSRERRAADREARKRDDIKKQIQKCSAKITQMLAHPTESKHVPVQLAQEVIEFMTMLNDFMNATVKEDATEPMTKRGKAIAEKLKQVYDDSFVDEETIKKAQAENPDYNPLGNKINEAFKDIMLSDMIKVVGDVISEKSVDNLTSEELTLINQVLRGVTRTVLDANKLVQSQIKEDAQEAGLQMMSELRANKKMNRAIRFYLEESLDLRRIARIFSRSNDDAVFVKLANELNEGAIEKERIAQVLQRIFDPVTEKYGDEIRKWYGKDAEWIDTGIVYKGREVRITKGMRVSLALHVLNEGNMKHIKNGGITIPDEQLYKKGHLKEAYADEQGSHLVRLDEEDINKIISDMTDAEKAYLEVAKDFFHNRTGYYINRTSLATVGYRKAMVKNYFPIHTDGMFNIKDLAQYFMQNGSVEGFGFLKDRVSGSNPILLEDITSVINRQIKGVSLYAGLAPAVRNWNAVLNAQEWEQVTEYDKEKEENKKVWRPFSSVEKTMTTVMGEEGVKVVKGFLADVQELNHVDVTPMERFAGKLATNYVKAVLLGNLKVAMKQVASYPTAAAVIPWKYLGKALLKGGRNHRLISRADVDLINQYTPLYQMRREGQANEIASIMQKRGLEQKLPWLLGLITKFDVATVGRLWSAAEYMVADQQNLPVGSDEYYKAVAKVFNDTIQQTQPNFTPLQRNAALRSKNPVVRSLVLFGTQRMQNGGILIEAAMELKQSKGKSKAEIQAARRKLGRAVASQIVQNILLIVASLGVDALRGRMKGWQDEDKEITAESLAKGMGDMFLSNFIGSFLGGSETYSLISGLFKKAMGETAYDTEFTVPALDAVETLINFAQSDVPDAVKYLLSDHTDEEKQKKAINFSYQLAKAFGYATGIPLENAVKDLFKGIIPAIKDHADYFKTGEFPQWWLHQSGKLDNANTAANYKEWTNLGKKGSVYLAWENRFKEDKSESLKHRAELLFTDRGLTADEKAILLRMANTTKDNPLTSKDGVVYKEDGTVAVDFTNPDRYRASTMLSDKQYEGFLNLVDMGVAEDVAATAFIQYNVQKKQGAKANDRFRDWLFKIVKNPEDRAKVDMAVIGNAVRVEGTIGYKENGEVYADYSSKEMFDLYTNGKKQEKSDAIVSTTETPEAKAKAFADTDNNYHAKGGIVYNDKDKVVADFTSDEAYRASQMGESHYGKYTEAVKQGMSKENAILAVEKHKEFTDDDDKDNATQYATWVFNTYKNAKDRAIAGAIYTTKPVTVKDGRTYDENGYIYRDYTSAAWYKLSNRTLSKDGVNKRYEAAKLLEKDGYTAEKTVAAYVELDKLSKKSEWQNWLKAHGYTNDQIKIILWSRGWSKLG